MSTERVTYTIRIYGNIFGMSGTMYGSAYRTRTVEEERSILGGMRAIDKAVEQVTSWKFAPAVATHAPEITPNPALLGWEVGTPNDEVQA